MLYNKCIYIYVVSGKRRMIIIENLSIDRLQMYIMETTGRGWGIWCVFVDGGRWGMCTFADGGIWGMEDRRVGRIENGGKLQLKQI